MHRVIARTPGWIRHEDATETVQVTLAYDPHDPLAVIVGIHGSECHDTSVVFARDLLVEGLSSFDGVGEGLVRLRATPVLLDIDLAEPVPLVLRVPWWRTDQFARECRAQVPLGAEHVDVDRLLDQLTSDEC